MLIETYDLQVVTPACLPGTEHYSAIARLTTDISPVLPYLNAALPGTVHQPTAYALTWKRKGHAVAFRATEIATSNVEDRAEAAKEIDGLIELVNRTWEQRSKITPDYKTHQRPTPMAAFKLLAQTNGRDCGEPTCFAFALKLAAAQKAVRDCPPLLEPQYSDQLAALQAIVVDARNTHVSEH